MIKKILTLLLQIVIVLFGMAALAFLLWEPTAEGVNAHATVFQMYFSFFVLYVYVASIPFFFALFHAFKVLGYARQDKESSRESVEALRRMKLCGLAMIGFAVVSVIFMIGGDRDDRPGGIFMRALITIPSVAIAGVAARFERNFQKMERRRV